MTRYTCDIPGYESCYLELSSRWTKGEVRRFFADNGEAWFALMRSKIVAIYLTQETGGAIDSAEAFVNGAVDEVDYVVWRWVQTAAQKAIDDLHSLGEASARRWLDGLDKPTTARDNPTPK